MRSVNRKNHQRLDAAEARRKQEQSHVVAETPRRRQSCLEIERQHGSEAAHLLPRELMIGMRRQSWIMHALYLSVPLEVFPLDHGVLTLLSPPDADRLHPANQQKRRLGIHRAAQMNDVFAHVMNPLSAARSRARYHVGMPGQIFRRAVYHYIESHLNRLLQHRARERAVNDRNQPVLF